MRTEKRSNEFCLQSLKCPSHIKVECLVIIYIDEWSGHCTVGNVSLVLTDFPQRKLAKLQNDDLFVIILVNLINSWKHIRVAL